MPKLREGDVLHGSYDFNPQMQTFTGVVARIRGKEMMVCNVGVEATEFAIAEWVRETIALMRKAGTTDVQVPDMVDRA